LKVDEPEITIPASFRQMPRWWSEGQQWLSDLPRLIAEQCRRWELRVVGEARHGSNALVLPVARGGAELVLRLNPPGEEVARHADALRFWAGRGTVLLVESDSATGAMLLERLASESLRDRPVAEAMVVLGAMMRRLAVPAPDWAPSTADIVRRRAGQLAAEWHELGEPFDRAFLAEALRVADALADAGAGSAANGDLHSEQVLRGDREEWLCVDPILLRGEIGYDLARVLWTRLDEMPDAASIVRHLDTVAAQAGLARDRARDLAVFRTVDYWLWGLRAGLTEDPLRCRRLAAAVVT
jgi:streptomycin 6-kinase